MPSEAVTQAVYVRSLVASHCITRDEAVKLTAERTGLPEDRVREIIWTRGQR